MKQLFLFLILINCYCSTTMGQQSIKITIELTGFSNDKGKAFVEVLNEKNKVITQQVIPVLNKKAVLVVSLPSQGKFAVKAFHDENDNQKLDKNLVGYPIEKWGVTNGVRPAFRAPTLEEMLVEINKSQKIVVELD